MAEDSDVPPLEDMTEVLRKVEHVREGILESVDKRPETKPSTAKARAKVKKNVAAHVIKPCDQDNSLKKSSESTDEIKTQVSSLKSDVSTSPSTSTQPVKSTQNSSNGMFGGMKKGFLFGSSPKSSNTSKPSEVTETAAKENAQPLSPSDVKKESKIQKEDNIPYICPKTGKTESGLTLDEVQQAMSETKSLLNNQDWINDDLLNKLEKNEFLLKRFADPHFMNALQEFQTNPQAAMEKYKSNKEVEKFLMEFCGLLGDHFTKIGDSVSNLSSSESSYKPPAPVTSTISSKVKPSSKIVELPSNNTKTTEAKKSPKIVELTLPEKDSGNNLGSQATPKSDILELDLGSVPGVKNEIPKIEPIDDKQIKELLNDSKVMEVLLDPEVMNLVKTLKSDPDKAHSIVEKADERLRDKITFLVSKRLLDFQVQ
ncbi:uncharacterized protein LOC106061145 isoform X1 [Biomphalaria glabrata]|uniref:Uncharacterized protein LOC106061145 isoform X1 n=2 Tax=Biomphalaria glabrata TaxID=6526 RepID=A0A9W3ALM3_BIOGL|nr:uncharacterized protein LOC106061145 isoform X1 [Biomphalaria glabrata]